MEYALSDILKEYSEKNTCNLYKPVAVGKYGIRPRSDIYKKELSNDYSKNKIIRKDTMIVGMGSTQIDFGVLSNDVIFSVSPAYHTYRIDSEIILSDYLELLLKAKNSEYTKKYMIASARQGKSVNLKEFLNEIVNIPDFSVQKRIINDIQIIKNIISLREETLNSYDYLIKSRFIEMFGDPIENKKGWETRKINDVCPINKYKGSVEHIDGKVWLLNLDMVESNTGRVIDYLYENEDEVNASTIIFDTNSVLYSKLRPYLNKVVVPDRSGYSTSEMIAMNTANVNRHFLATLLRTNSFVAFANATAYGAKMPRASVDGVKNFDLIMPPRNLQDEFGVFVERIDKSKFIVQKQINLLQELLDKKMNEYFS